MAAAEPGRGASALRRSCKSEKRHGVLLLHDATTASRLLSFRSWYAVRKVQTCAMNNLGQSLSSICRVFSALVQCPQAEHDKGVHDHACEAGAERP
jgi:hypothetical protein